MVVDNKMNVADLENVNGLRRFVLEYFARIDFGPSPYEQFLTICWNILTYRNTLWRILSLTVTIVIMLTVSIQFNLVHSTSYINNISNILYLSVHISSLYCIYLYINILMKNHETNGIIWQLNMSPSSIPLRVRTVLGLFEFINGIYILYELLLSYLDLDGLSYVYMMYILALSILKLTECFLGSLLFVFICPLQNTWMEYATITTKQHIVQLTPWLYYYLINNLLLSITLRYNNSSLYTSSAIVYIIVYIYVFLKLLWLSYLTLQISNTSLVPVTRHPESDMNLLAENIDGISGWIIDSKSEVITGFEDRIHSLTELPAKSEYVCGTVTDRFRDIVKPLPLPTDNTRPFEDRSLLLQEINPIMNDEEELLVEEEIAYNNNEYLTVMNRHHGREMIHSDNSDHHSGNTVTEKSATDGEVDNDGIYIDNIQPLRQRKNIEQ